MKQKKLLIYGVGRFAEYAAFVFTHDSDYDVMGFCMEASYLEMQKPDKLHDEIFSFDTLESHFSPSEYELFIAVGNNKIRHRIFEAARHKGYALASYLSSKAIFWESLEIGQNSFVSEATFIQPLVKIGDNAIFFGAGLGHHCNIGSHVLLSACTLGGNVKVGDFSFIGMNAAIQENRVIAEKNIIGMGSNISFNTKVGEIYTSPSAKRSRIIYDDFM